MSRALPFVALALVALGGCTKARTEAVVVVTTEGVRIPDDIDALDLVVADTTDLANPVFQKSFRICGSDVSSDCFSLPLDFTLIPGPHRDHSSRVQITATRHQAPEIADAAIFTFAEGVSLRLDFVLYANCLGNVDCAALDQACGPDAACHPVPAVPINGEPDLSLPPPGDLAVGDDLAVGVDLAIPPDLAHIPDMAAPNDLTITDMAGCTPFCALNYCGVNNCGGPCMCSLQTVCNPGTSNCDPCGNAGQACCGQGICSGSLHCFGVPPGTCDVPDMAMGGPPPPPDQILTWTSMTFDTGTFYGIWANGNDAFAVGDHGTLGAIWQRSGGSSLGFTADAAYTSATVLRAVSATDVANAWAAGDSATIVYRMGSVWSPAPGGNPVTSGTYYGIWVGGPGSPSVEAVGGTRNGSCMDVAINSHYDPMRGWVGNTANATGTCAWGAVWGSNLGFIAWPGNEHRVAFSPDDDQTEYTYSFQVTSNVYMHGIWGVTKGQMWVVGDNGTIYRFGVDKFNGGFSSAETSGVSLPLNAVSGTGAGDLWAVGPSGTILHSFGDTTWTKQTNVGNQFQVLYGVYAVAPHDVYVVGSEMGMKVVLHGQ